MFTKGQWIFAILFVITFVIIIAVAYGKDINIHKKYYKGTIWVLLAFIIFVGLIALIKFVLG